MIKAYGGDIVEGDAYLINHPYEGGSPHAPDMAVITPIFVAGERIGFCGSIAHKSDIGGPVPGSCSGQAKETFNEGLHLPAVRYFRGGQRNVEIERIIAANSRTPELVLGDIRGQLGASRLGEQRVAELIGKFGKANALASFQRLLDLAEKKMRTAISEWVDGRFEAERFIDDDGIELNKPVRIHVVVEKKGDTIRFDFSGSADQTKGPANVRPPLVRAAVGYALISLVDPLIFINSGIMRSYEITTREGSVLNPRFPAPVNTYNATVHAMVEACSMRSPMSCRRAPAPMAAAAAPSSSAGARPPRARPMCNMRSSAAARADVRPRTARREPRSTRATPKSPPSRSSKANFPPACSVSS